MANDIVLTVRADDQASGVFGAVEGKAKGLGGALGGALKVGALAGAGAIAGLGVGLLKIGMDFDEQFDKIRVGTGATGDALKGLQGDFKDVFSSIPTDMASAGTAISEFNSRLGLTGEPLQTLSKQVLELSRITETDLQANIEAVSGVMQNWQIPTDQQSAKLDKLFVASQASGIAVSDLSENMQGAGAALRDLGFDFDTSTAMLASWSKAGLDSDKMVAALRKSVVTLTKDGKPLAQGLQETLDKIQALGPGAESTTLAMEVFGAKAGPELAEAILSGKFAYDDMLATMQGSSDTIMKAGADTQDFGEKFTILKNKILVAIEPLATKFMGTLTDLADLLLEKVVPAVESFIYTLKTGFTEDEGTFIEKLALTIRNDVIPVLEDVAAFMKGELKDAFAQLKQVIEGLTPVVKDLTKFMKEHPEVMIAIAAALALLVIALGGWTLAIPAAIAVGIALLAHWDDIRAGVDSLIAKVGDFIHKVEEIPIIGEIFQMALDNVIAIVKARFDEIKLEVETAINVVRDIIKIVTALIEGDWSEAWEGIKQLFADIWEGIKGLTEIQLGLLKNLMWNQLQLIVGVVGDAIPLMLDAGLALMEGLWTGVKKYWDDVLMFWFVGLPLLILGAIGDLLQLLVQKGIDAIAGLGNGMVSAWTNSVLPWLEGLPLKIRATVANLDNLLVGIGSDIINGLWNGMKGKWEDVKSWLGGIAGTIKGLKGPPEKDKTLLKDVGGLIIGGLWDGMKQKWDEVAPKIKQIGTDIKGAFADIDLSEALRLFNTPFKDSVNAMQLWAAGFHEAALKVLRDLANLGSEADKAAAKLKPLPSPGGGAPSPPPPAPGNNPNPGQPPGTPPGGDASGGGGEGGLVTISKLIGGAAAQSLFHAYGTNFLKAIGSPLGWGAFNKADLWGLTSWLGKTTNLAGFESLMSNYAIFGASTDEIHDKLKGYGLPFDQGGWLMPGLTLARNDTGRPERVLGPDDPPGGGVHVHFHTDYDLNSPAQRDKVGRQVAALVRQYA